MTNQAFFEHEIKEQALINRINARLTFFKSLVARYGASGFSVDNHKKYGLIVEFISATKPDASLKKCEGLTTWMVVKDSPLQKEMIKKGVEIKFSEIKNSVGLKPTSIIYTIRNYDNKRFVVISDDPSGLNIGSIKIKDTRTLDVI